MKVINRLLYNIQSVSKVTKIISRVNSLDNFKKKFQYIYLLTCLVFKLLGFHWVILISSTPVFKTKLKDILRLITKLILTNKSNHKHASVSEIFMKIKPFRELVYMNFWIIELTKKPLLKIFYLTFGTPCTKYTPSWVAS